MPRRGTLQSFEGRGFCACDDGAFGEVAALLSSPRPPVPPPVEEGGAVLVVVDVLPRVGG